MSEKIENINSAIINHFIRVIRSLGRSGKNDYQTYLIRPLSVWTPKIFKGDLEDILFQIEQVSLMDDTKMLGSLYKKAIIKSITDGKSELSRPGNLSLDFLKEMQNNNQITDTIEASEFINILNKPFQIYSDYEYKIANTQFGNEINDAAPEKVKELLNARNSLQMQADKEKGLAESLLKKIEQNISGQNLTDVKKNIISYLLRVSSSNDPELHKKIEPLLQKIEMFNPGFSKDVMDTCAVLIYHEIVKAIKSKELKKAVTFITKYTVLFRGNPDTPNHFEVDSFEKQFFELVEKRDLWDSI